MAGDGREVGIIAFGPLGGISGKELQSALGNADAAFKQGRWDEAVEAYRDVMARSAALSVINLQIGAAYRHKKDYTAALAAYDALLKVDPDKNRKRSKSNHLVLSMIAKRSSAKATTFCSSP